ncbi:MAG TPA: hypothetical protein VND23_06300 [Acidimicrobiales bacterium]|nr:hypothetical protein [Acidimicrobiales bacterium]
MTDTALSPATPAGGPRSAADAAMCRLLRVPMCPDPTRQAQAQRLFSGSILLSALRCLLSYVVLPVLTPLLGAATSVGPAVGLPIGIVALYFDVRGIRRFWLAGHRRRWAITVIYAVVMALVLALVVGDVLHLAR